MVESVVIDVDEDPKGQEMNGQDRPRKPQKRKRASLAQVPPKPEDKAAQIEALRVELDGLFRYYKELKEKRVVFDLGMCSSVNAVVVALMEESELPLSKLVEEIHEKAKGSGVTVASVKSSVLFVGQRVMYGVPNAEADVLEDESEVCLWCWEVIVWVFSSFFVCFCVMGLFHPLGVCRALCLIWCWDGSFLVDLLIVLHV
jgi:chromatin assembly factor 1 subunit A